MAAAQDALVDIATEGWRFLRVVERLSQTLDGDQQKRLASRMSFFQKKLHDGLEAAGLKLVRFDGQPFEAGMAATALNIGEFEGGSALLVDQTLEPAVLGPDGVVRLGTVTVKRMQP